MGIQASTLNRWIDKFGESLHEEKEPVRIESNDVQELVGRVQDALMSSSQEKYEGWITRVAHFQAKGYSLEEAQVCATKEIESCKYILADYDVRHLDRDPDSHTDVAYKGDANRSRVVCLNKDINYRGCMRWAAANAGMYMRTKVHPSEVPSDLAFFLYNMALDEPKDFAAKLNQTESREDTETQLEKDTRKQTDRSVAEIDRWLNEIDKQRKEDGEEAA